MPTELEKELARTTEMRGFRFGMHDFLGHLLGAEADGVDVPGGESQAHGGFPVRPRKTRPEARAVRA